MRKPANHPRATGKTETPPEEHFPLSGTDAAARRARLELDALLDDAPALASRLPPGFADGAERYVALLLLANARLNLTRVTAPADVARLHLLDALSALPLLPADLGSAVDLGSGGGVPGIPLALARPDVAWVLVDSVHKKANVLREITAELGLTNVSVVAERAETLGHDRTHRGRHDLAVARACAMLPVVVELALPLLAIGGRLLAWKGPIGEGDRELSAGAAAARLLGGGEPEVVDPGLPALGGHRLIVVRKERANDARYPRRPGEPSRRPLG
jgi:16S rRNA (guanine527-N7)-methyltransferase